MQNCFSIAAGITLERMEDYGCDLPFNMTFVLCSCFCKIGLCKAGRGLFWGSNLESATWLSKAGSHFGGQAPRVPKMSKNESSQNDILYSGKRSHTLGEHFKAIPDS